MVFVDFPVIANQCSHWCGNLLQNTKKPANTKGIATSGFALLAMTRCLQQTVKLEFENGNRVECSARF